MSSAPQTVVAYRSRWEADASEFWYAFFSNHPWLVLSLLGVFVALLIASQVVPAFLEWRERKKKNPLEDFTHEQLVMISTIGSLESLTKKGLMTGPKVLTKEGNAALRELRKRGFKPTSEETQHALRALAKS